MTIIWVFFIVPEMKGFTIEQLEYLFDNHVPTRKFANYKFSDGDVIEGSPDTIEGDISKGDVKAKVISATQAVKKAL